ncbi:patatin-like phospholipase family protein [Motiliproteus sediminis]|uniref:patatin-like phospholipase family protein n=1 Tax=Motiliproteus sediminis TaxID=1468178 RepID=UPI001AEF709B|nr:patatin-like phospholipase family protein [Motiliproteus sediminis]
MRKTPISLALQGGGAHGAFTWGVLDRLLDEPGFDPCAISGCSAGAMNAVVLAHGWQQGGASAAQLALRQFWEAVSQESPLAWLAVPGSSALADKVSFSWHQMLAQTLSRTAVADLSPLDVNPLRQLLQQQIDFDRLRAPDALRLFISATDVASGQLRVFRNADLSLDALLASACLPTLHRTVEVDGRAYWDGGFSANPAIHPLVYEAAPADILLVLLQPSERHPLPRSASEIADRTAELGFGSNLLRELRAITLARQYAGRWRWWGGRLERRLKRLRFHLLEPDELLAELPRASKYDTRSAFLQRLFQAGREQAGQWLEANGNAVGRRASVDLERLYGEPLELVEG